MLITVLLLVWFHTVLGSFPIGNNNNIVSFYSSRMVVGLCLGIVTLTLGGLMLVVWYTGTQAKIRDLDIERVVENAEMPKANNDIVQFKPLSPLQTTNTNNSCSESALTDTYLNTLSIRQTTSLPIISIQCRKCDANTKLRTNQNNLLNTLLRE
ncbi:hypothetical protein SNEBB_006511 [Seison nebaliae]|nr:hypothetical protein SNEBB_006511 [Seison nebaliae]